MRSRMIIVILPFYDVVLFRSEFSLPIFSRFTSITLRALVRLYELLG